MKVEHCLGKVLPSNILAGPLLLARISSRMELNTMSYKMFNVHSVIYSR